MPPQDITQGMPMFIMAIIRSQASVKASAFISPIGVAFKTMPPSFISQVILAIIIGIIMPGIIICGIIIPGIMLPIICGIIMLGIMLPIIGIVSAALIEVILMLGRGASAAHVSHGVMRQLSPALKAISTGVCGFLH
jgi:hypothetical protein